MPRHRLKGRIHSNQSLELLLALPGADHCCRIVPPLALLSTCHPSHSCPLQVHNTTQTPASTCPIPTRYLLHRALPMSSFVPAQHKPKLLGISPSPTMGRESAKSKTMKTNALQRPSWYHRLAPPAYGSSQSVACGRSPRDVRLVKSWSRWQEALVHLPLWLPHNHPLTSPTNATRISSHLKLALRSTHQSEAVVNLLSPGSDCRKCWPP